MQTTTYKNVAETIYTETLENGLKVYILPRPEITKTFGIFTTNFGSNDIHFEPIGKTGDVTAPFGVAHFLEHKLFDKGDHDVFADFGKLGASANAYTNSTQTAYLFSATENIPELVELLVDFVQDPYFSDETVEKEKGIIIQEAQMYLDDPDERLYMATMEALFKEHPIKYPVIGTIDSINSITKEDLYTTYHTFYHPSNMSLCIMGNVDEKEMMQLIRENQAAKKFEPTQEIKRFAEDEPVGVAKPEAKVAMPVTSPKCMVGIKEYATRIDEHTLLHREIMTKMVLGHLFSRSGLFYKDLYEEGLVDYSFGYQYVCERDFGYTLISGNTKDPQAFQKRMKELLLQTNTLELTEGAFSRMKKREIGSLLRGMNSIEYLAQEYTWNRDHGNDFFERIPAIQELTLEDINTFISTWIDEERLTICTLTNE